MSKESCVSDVAVDDVMETAVALLRREGPDVDINIVKRDGVIVNVSVTRHLRKEIAVRRLREGSSD